MSEHDDWMTKATGVNVPALRLNTLGQPAINLFPANLSGNAAAGTASAPAPPAPKPAPPPKDALARAGDSRPFWRPAPAGGTDKPEADRTWLGDFLRFYRAGPPNPADAKGTSCSFNGTTMTVDAALDIVDAQATLNGYKPGRSTAKGLLQDLMKEGAENAALGEQVGKDLGAKKVDIAADVAKLSALPMARLLDVLERMKAQKKLDDFEDHMPPDISRRLGVALVTVQGRFEDIVWQTEAPKLSEEDRAAVMMRAPAKIRPITPGPAKAGDKPEDPVEVEAVIAGSRDGVEMQVKITAHSSNGAKLGETEGTAHIGPRGKLSQLELDITAFQIALTGKDSVAEVTVTVSGNATIDMDKDGSHIDKNGLNAQIKAELAISLKRVKALQGVTAKVNGTYGTGGTGGTIGLEFKIPGS
jgi:hypothetical protein